MPAQYPPGGQSENKTNPKLHDAVLQTDTDAHPQASMQSIRQRHRVFTRFLAIYFGTLAILGLPALASIWFLYNAGEMDSYSEVVEHQQLDLSVYGSAVNGNSFRYKLALARQREPKLIVLGSSRVATFRQEYFSVPFVNASSAMNDPAQGSQFLNALFRDHKPETVLIGFDFWWLNGNWFFSRPVHDRPADTLTQEKLLRPLSWFINKELPPKTFLNVILKGDTSNNVTNWNNRGMQAIQSSAGFRYDGSFHYAQRYFGAVSDFDNEFERTIARVEEGSMRFQYGSQLSEARWTQWLDLVEVVRSNGVHLVVFSTPVAPEVLDKMAQMGRKYDFIQEMHNAFGSSGVEYYDFLSANTATSNSCEYVDGLHAGEVTSQKMLLSMLDQNPGSTWLANSLNVDLMNKTVAGYDGKALSMFDPSRYETQEVDFLNLGCEKPGVLVD